MRLYFLILVSAQAISLPKSLFQSVENSQKFDFKESKSDNQYLLHVNFSPNNFVLDVEKEIFSQISSKCEAESLQYDLTPQKTLFQTTLPLLQYFDAESLTLLLWRPKKIEIH